VNHYELEQIIRKRAKIAQLRRAKQRVKQLERELRGEPQKETEDFPYVPMFLRARRGHGLADPRAFSISLLRDENGALATLPTSHWEPLTPANGAPAAPPHTRVVEGSQARSRVLIDLLAEPTT